MNGKWLIRTGMALVANAVTILIAAAVLPRFWISGFWSFLFAVIIFTLATMGVKALLGRFTKLGTWAAGLVTTWLALLVTDVLSRGIQVEGIFTWIFAVLIVWAGTLVYDLIDDKAFAEVSKRMPRGSGPTARPTT
ncbi:superfamily IV 4 TMS phage holin [Stackebrandtia endophytica]|uniref:Superfamily IV 4 TMS phage holin n=1 Tax=Stackebrandtia endophytica TaxID=1496996 RepID=A0A543ARB0_9ACTN|nr:phage holin family protein [Stackebrandtia endophytica]TQL75128.1 superfamily IV 4 TMS phage holin [Stackebrandtia endophytica]